MTSRRNSRLPLSRAATAAALVALLFSPMATAQAPEGHRFAERSEHRFDRLAERLGLSEAQKNDLLAVHENQREAMKPMLEELQVLRGELETELESEAADALRIGDKMLEIRDLKREVEASHDNLQAEVESILTPEQIEQMQSFRSSMRERFRSRRDGGDSDGASSFRRRGLGGRFGG